MSFKRGQLKVLSLEWDRNLGGRDFDEVLFDHFVEEFDAKYKIDIRSNKRASFRLRLAVEKVFFANCKVLIFIPGMLSRVSFCGCNPILNFSAFDASLF